MAAPAVPGIAQPGFLNPGDPGPPSGSPVATASPPNLPGPSVPFFPAGYQPAGPDFYAWWYLNAAFFQQKVVFRATQTATTTPIAADGNSHTIQYDNIGEDRWSGWNAGTFTWTPKISGQYRITVTAFVQPVAAGTMLVPALGGTYSQRGAVVSGATMHNSGAEGTWTVYLAGGQSTVVGQVAQLNASSPVSTTNTAGQQSSIEIAWLSN